MIAQGSITDRRSHADSDRSRREAKAHQILDVLSGSSGDLRVRDVLDIGTGSGIIASTIAPHCRSLVSVDVVDERIVRDFSYERIKAEHLPFPDGSFDIVITNHVVEHVHDPALHLREITRVLRPAGVAYLAMPNKWSVVEPHFQLPFLSWMPQRFGDLYVRLAHKGSHYDVQPLAFGDLARLAVAADLVLSDQSGQLVDRRVAHRIGVGGGILRLMHPLFPSYVVLLTRRDSSSPKRSPA